MIRIFGSYVLLSLSASAGFVLLMLIRRRRRPFEVDFDLIRKPPLQHGGVIRPRISKRSDGTINVRCSCPGEGAEIIAANRGLQTTHSEVPHD